MREKEKPNVSDCRPPLRYTDHLLQERESERERDKIKKEREKERKRAKEFECV